MSNKGTNFLLQQRSEEIPTDDCFSERKHSTKVYSKEQLHENPASNISNNNGVDTNIEPTIDTITKRKHDFKKSVDIDIQILNNVSKPNNEQRT